MVQTERQKITQAQYREANKDKIAAARNTPEARAKQKAYRDDPVNKAKNAAYMDEFRQTPEGIKSFKIGNWKNKYKIFSHDWDATYDWFNNVKNCENCNVLLEKGKGNNGKCLDHNHSIVGAPNIRAVLCMNCNKHEGKVKHASPEARKEYWSEKIACEFCGRFLSRVKMKRHRTTQVCKANFEIPN